MTPVALTARDLPRRVPPAAAGTGDAHHLVNRSDADVLYIEVGDRTPGDTVTYPDDDLAGRMAPDGTWVYSRKNGASL